MHTHLATQSFIDTHGDSWVKLYGYLSYFGHQKEAEIARLNTLFGEGNWYMAHSFRGELMPQPRACLEYEEGYYHFLKSNPDIRNWIAETASDVYDFDPGNVQSGLDYTEQESTATHLQDIAVRRVLTRLRLEEQGQAPDPDNLPMINIFKGDHLVQIRDKESEGFVLNPGEVPHHRPQDGLGRLKPNWWRPDSIEDIYQRNKVLMVRPEALGFQLSLMTPDAAHFSIDGNKRNLFALDPAGKDLTCEDGRALRNRAQQDDWQDTREIVNAPKLPLNEAWGLALRTTHNEGSFAQRYPKKHYAYGEFLELLRLKTQDC